MVCHAQWKCLYTELHEILWQHVELSKNSRVCHLGHSEKGACNKAAEEHCKKYLFKKPERNLDVCWWEHTAQHRCMPIKCYVCKSIRGYLGMKSSPKMSAFVILDRYGQVCKAIKLLLCLFKRILIEDLDVCQVRTGASRPIKMLHT